MFFSHIDVSLPLSPSFSLSEIMSMFLVEDKKHKSEQKIWIDIFQRRNTDGQQVYENVLNIINHLGNANENCKWDAISHLLLKDTK